MSASYESKMWQECMDLVARKQMVSIRELASFLILLFSDCATTADSQLQPKLNHGAHSLRITEIASEFHVSVLQQPVKAFSFSGRGKQYSKFDVSTETMSGTSKMLIVDLCKKITDSLLRNS